MPFDGVSSEGLLDPLGVVDRLAACLTHEANWRRGSFGGFGSGSRCLYGWLNVIDHGTQFWWYLDEPFKFKSDSVVIVHDRIMQRTTPLLFRLIGRYRLDAGIRFNDHFLTDHLDVVRMIGRVRRDIVSKN